MFDVEQTMEPEVHTHFLCNVRYITWVYILSHTYPFGRFSQLFMNVDTFFAVVPAIHKPPFAPLSVPDPQTPVLGDRAAEPYVGAAVPAERPCADR